MTKLSQTLQFAQDELCKFLPGLGSHVNLRLDSNLPPYSFSGTKDQNEIVLSGADESCVLHAVYTFLEQMGWRFEITGPVRIGDANLAAFEPFSITPAVKWRGIRQHINFPMDISSYTLKDAQEYIRNLARLRFNHITFHSYPNQWIDGDQDAVPKTAGAFFYGQRHDIPDHPLLKKVIANTKTFCIPEIEPHYDDAEKKSDMAIAWLQAVMAEAKRCGLRLQFSFEPRKGSLELTLTTCRHILDIYPQIDILELMGYESHGWAEKAVDAEIVRQALAAHYSEEMLNSPEFRAAMESGKANFDIIMNELARLLPAVKTFQPEATAKRVQVALGVYCVEPKYHPAIFRVVREGLPKTIPFTILAEHSSGRVANALAQIVQDEVDWQRTFVYSWEEFDGLMYLQQNGVPGLERLLAQLQGKVQGMAFNHWRTAENQLAARYAAEACLTGSVPAANFYADYACALGIGDPEAFARAHELMDDADWMATNQLFNIGFCYYSCWGRQGLGYFEAWQIRDIEENHGLYEQAHRLMCQSARQTASEVGREFLSFLDNRVRCTMIYLKAMSKGAELQAFKGLTPDQLTEEQKKELVEICDKAIAMLEQYMTLHAEAMPDRGCEGTLISLYHTPPAVLKRIRQDYAGIPSDQPPADTGHDEPPSPIEW